MINPDTVKSEYEAFQKAVNETILPECFLTIGWNAEIGVETFGGFVKCGQYKDLDVKILPAIIMTAVSKLFEQAARTSEHHGLALDYSTLRFKAQWIPPEMLK